jgi:hypothetical protein
MQQISHSKLDGQSKQKYQQLLRTHLRKLIRTNKEHFPFHQHYGVYELAYPHGMHLYWLCLVALRKLKIK